MIHSKSQNVILRAHMLISHNLYDCLCRRHRLYMKCHTYPLKAFVKFRTRRVYWKWRKRRLVTWPSAAANQRRSSVGHLLICVQPRLAAAFSRRRLTTSAMCLVELVRSRRLASHLRSWETLSWHCAASEAASAPSTYGCSRCSSYHARRIVMARAGSGLERPAQLHTEH